MNPWVDPQIIESFFNDPSVIATLENGTLYQMCYSGQHEVAFVVYGEFEGFEGTKNLIGIFTGGRVIEHHLFNPSSGDIGLCAIEGFIDRSVVYACGGGDAPLVGTPSPSWIASARSSGIAASMRKALTARPTCSIWAVSPAGTTGVKHSPSPKGTYHFRPQQATIARSRSRGW